MERGGHGQSLRIGLRGEDVGQHQQSRKVGVGLIGEEVYDMTTW